MITIAAEPLVQYSSCSLDPRMAATYRHVNMKALARYQIILLGEQRHIGVAVAGNRTHDLPIASPAP